MPRPSMDRPKRPLRSMYLPWLIMYASCANACRRLVQNSIPTDSRRSPLKVACTCTSGEVSAACACSYARCASMNCTS